MALLPPKVFAMHSRFSDTHLKVFCCFRLAGLVYVCRVKGICVYGKGCIYICVYGKGCMCVWYGVWYGVYVCIVKGI